MRARARDSRAARARALLGAAGLLAAAVIGAGCGSDPGSSDHAAAMGASAKPLPARPKAAPSGLPDSAAVLATLSGVVNATCPLPGVASGGQVGADHLKGLAGLGFRTVLDLRTADEPRGYDESRSAARAGLEYLNLPVSGATLDDAMFDRVRELMSDPRRHPVIVHCASGNRVGVALLPWLVLDRGWKLPEAIAAAEQGGMRASPLRDRALDYIARKGTKR